MAGGGAGGDGSGGGGGGGGDGDGDDDDDDDMMTSVAPPASSSGAASASSTTTTVDAFANITEAKFAPLMEISDEHEDALKVVNDSVSFVLDDDGGDDDGDDFDATSCDEGYPSADSWATETTEVQSPPSSICRRSATEGQPGLRAPSDDFNPASFFASTPIPSTGTSGGRSTGGSIWTPLPGNAVMGVTLTDGGSLASPLQLLGDSFRATQSPGPRLQPPLPPPLPPLSPLPPLPPLPVHIDLLSTNYMECIRAGGCPTEAECAKLHAVDPREAQHHQDQHSQFGQLGSPPQHTSPMVQRRLAPGFDAAVGPEDHDQANDDWYGRLARLGLGPAPGKPPEVSAAPGKTVDARFEEAWAKAGAAYGGGTE